MKNNTAEAQNMTTAELTAPETDVRQRILVTAERLFRNIGYQKTTVADIAKELGMSPANVYRFFDSKKAIHEGVARRLMGEVEVAIDAIARTSKPATARLREILTSIHFMNTERYVEDIKIHDMVAIAMEESWNVCEAHIMYLTGVIGRVLSDGMATGEFRRQDVDLTAHLVCTSMVRFFDPQLIARCARKPGPSLDQMTDFVIESLR
jgi:AcrR family transcriptional regulator